MFGLHIVRASPVAKMPPDRKSTNHGNRAENVVLSQWLYLIVRKTCFEDGLAGEPYSAKPLKLNCILHQFLFL